ncbi:MAG: DNA mismatch repair protein MutS [Planctomycetota bacterium]|jgi:DNA mismatch repair protein MutS|nr:DNA mismatch repair protein MutS [Planctomycetota bacterium]
MAADSSDGPLDGGGRKAAEAGGADEGPATPAMRQWREMKARHPDKLLLFRMGDFYEMFNDDAVEAARLVGLTLTRRGRTPDSPPLAGLPHHQLDRYIREFMLKGRSLAICDQLEDPAQAKGVVKRGITRVVTPGAVVDDDILPSTGNNYLSAAVVRGDEAAAAFADLSTGEFLVSLAGPSELPDVFERLAPAETLLPGEAIGNPGHPLAWLAGAGSGVTRRDSYFFDPGEGETVLKRHFGVASLAPFDLEGRPAALGAAGAVLSYFLENQPDSLRHLRPPRLLDPGGVLKIDRNSIRNLELASSRPDGGRPTLLSLLDHALTGPGSRLLRQWLLAPPAELETIRRRQGGVGELLADSAKRGEFRALLNRMADFERIAARISANRAGPRDLSALAAGCRRLPALAALAASCSSEAVRDCAGLDQLADLADLVDGALVPSPPALARDGGLIREGRDPEVDELRRLLGGGREWMDRFQVREQARTGIPSLKVGFNKVFGYFLEITHAHKLKVPPDYVRKQTLVNAERYITPELKEHEEKALGAEERLLARETRLFSELLAGIGQAVGRIQDTAAGIARLDALLSLAEAGERGRFVMPEIHDGLDTFIEGGRHPVVESLLPAGAFVENDVRFAGDSQRILIVTGPNMAGKSTYIRQAALIVVMAHMGAPVPAKSARIGLADRIFSRVGASDDLGRGQSTFMVEMLETAGILHNASERSLIVLDEVGRGTSTFDGVSLAWAITEYLHHRIKARTLFATHYHELSELGHILPRAKNFNVAVRDWGDDIVFLRKIQPGACDRSYGIQVGRMAGIPPPVIERAREILSGLEEQAAEHESKILGDSRDLLRASAREVQLKLFSSPRKMEEAGRRLLRELADVDINLLSPLDSHALLGRLADRARSGGLSRN